MYNQARMWEQLAARFEPKPDYRADPTSWLDQRMGEYAWSKQREILDSVRDNTYTAVHSCHDAGKSFIASRVISHFIDTHEIGKAFVVSTAPSAAQVSAVLWREISKAHLTAKAHGTPLPGRINTAGYPQWKIDGILVGYGRKPADHSDSAMQGIHDQAVLVVLDEAGGIQKHIWDAVDALTTNEDVRILAIGNPDSVGTHFHQVCTPGSKLGYGWNKIHIDALRTPNMNEQYIRRQLERGILDTDMVDTLYQIMEENDIPWNTEEVPDELRTFLVSPRWIATQAVRWGQKSSLWTSKVRGQFPESNTEGIIPLGWVEAAMARWRDWQDSGCPPDWTGRRVIACDVARFGSDSTVIGVRQGRVLQTLTPHQGMDTVETTEQLKRTAVFDHNQQPEIAHTLFVVDANGIGGSVVDQMRHERIDNLVAFNGASRDLHRRDATGEYDFRNNRTAAYWNLRELLDPSKGFKIMLPDIEELKADLTCATWGVQKGGQPRIYMEERDEVKKRLGRSPDYGDTAAMAFWHEAGVLDSDADGVVDWEQSDPYQDDGICNWS